MLAGSSPAAGCSPVTYSSNMTGTGSNLISAHVDNSIRPTSVSGDVNEDEGPIRESQVRATVRNLTPFEKSLLRSPLDVPT